MKNNIAYIKFLFVSLFIFISTTSSAGEQSNMTIASVIPGSGGILIGFATQPQDCAGNYKKAHAFLSSSSAQFDQLFAFVALAELTGDQVKISYQDAGNCTSSGSLLQLSNIE